jgi:uncharacterized protein
MMRRSFVRLAFVLLLLAGFSLRAEQVDQLPAPTGYVDDYAHVLSGAAQTDLEEECRELHSKTRAQIFLVTVKDLGGETKEQFANRLFERWKIGEKGTDRGILILLAIHDHQYWIEVGYGFEGILNDAKAGDIGREMVPALKAADYDKAARTSVGEIANIIAADNAATAAQAPSPNPDTRRVIVPAPTRERDATQVLDVVMPVLLLCGVVALAIAGRRRRYQNESMWSSRNRVEPAPAANFVTGAVIGSSMEPPVSPPAFFDPGSSGGSSFGGGDSGASFGGGDTGSSFTGGDGGMSGGGGAGGDW